MLLHGVGYPRSLVLDRGCFASHEGGSCDFLRWGLTRRRFTRGFASISQTSLIGPLLPMITFRTSVEQVICCTGLDLTIFEGA